MPRPRKLSPNLEREVLQRYAQGVRTKDLIQWLQSEHGVEISAQALNKFLRETREERAEVAKTVVREALTDHVTSDIDILKRSLTRVERLERRLHRKANRALSIAEAIAAGKRSVGPDGEPLDPKVAIALASGADDAAAIALKASAEVRAQVDTKLEFAGAKGPDAAAQSAGDARAAQDELLGRLARLAGSGKA